MRPDQIFGGMSPVGMLQIFCGNLSELVKYVYGVTRLWFSAISDQWRVVLKNKTHHPISCYNHPSATTNKAINSLIWGMGTTKRTQFNIQGGYKTNSVRFRATATLRRPQIKQSTTSNERGYKTNGNIIIILTKYQAVHPTAALKNYSSSGMLTILITIQTVSSGNLIHIVRLRSIHRPNNILKNLSTLFLFALEMKGHWSHVNIVKREALLKNLQPVRTLGLKSRIRPPYHQRVVKGD